MKRRLFNLLAAGSLVMCSLCLVLWLWSKITAAGLWYESRRGNNWYAVTSDGDLIFATFDTAKQSRLTRDDDFGWHFIPLSVGGRSLGQQNGGSIHSRLGLVPALTTLPYPDHFNNGGWGFQVFTAWARVVVVPYWLLVAAFAIPPIRWERAAYRERIRKQRIRAGRCPEYAYDLRASKERCPEGRTAIPR